MLPMFWLRQRWRNGERRTVNAGPRTPDRKQRCTVGMSASEKKTELIKTRLPLFQGILPLDRSRVLPDIMAGITLAAVGIPEVIAYTKIIDTPVITGLYTMLLPILAFAIFGSSRHLVVGADSATAVIVAAALVSLAVPSSSRYVALTGLVALVAAGMLLLAQLLRLGFLADFLSRTVLVGFLTGVGVQVAFGELHGMLGLEKGGNGFFGSLLFTFQHLPETHFPSMIISLCVVGVVAACDRIAAQFPGALLAVVGMIVVSIVFHLEKSGVKVVEKVSSGLPRLSLPDLSWSDVPLVLSVSVSCFIVILAQSAATSRAYALRYRERFDENYANANYFAEQVQTLVTQVQAPVHWPSACIFGDVFFPCRGGCGRG
jgi:SulP family sulfate permease